MDAGTYSKARADARTLQQIGGYNERGKTSREKAQQINISKAMGDTMGYCHGFIYRNCQPYGVFEHRAAALFRSARLFGRERMAKKDL